MPLLKLGDVVRFSNKSLWLVTRVNSCSARIVPITGVKKRITTKSGKHVDVYRRPNPQHIAPMAGVDVLDPESALAKWARETFKMSITEVPEGGAEPVVRKQRATQIYVRTEKERPGRLGGQGAIVLDAIDALGQATAAQVNEATKGKFQTRQPEERIVAFYLAKFKRAGLLKAVGPEEAAPATETEGISE